MSQSVSVQHWKHCSVPLCGEDVHSGIGADLISGSDRIWEIGIERINRLAHNKLNFFPEAVSTFPFGPFVVCLDTGTKEREGVSTATLKMNSAQHRTWEGGGIPTSH